MSSEQCVLFSFDHSSDTEETYHASHYQNCAIPTCPSKCLTDHLVHKVVIMLKDLVLHTADEYLLSCAEYPQFALLEVTQYLTRFYHARK